MKSTPLILSLFGLAAVGAAASSLVSGTYTSAAQEPQEKKTDEASKGKDKEKKAEKVTVWIMDSTGSG